ncbi:hypothetical protein KIL84_003860 [Mauremys mutica]|uniref:Uncharacterized protein n=1 Tax=Mauremys mutica TaxID=74926 RepID=A0A9D3WWK4_9SAUR|nr:hypothetical protein KIL84_003860 [Mauremys mutica]
MACCAQVRPIVPPLQNHSLWNVDRGCCVHVSVCLALVHMGLSDPGERVRPPGAGHGALLHAVSPTGWRVAARTRAHTPACSWLLVGSHPARRRIQEHCTIAQAEVLPQAAWKGLACAQQLPGIEGGRGEPDAGLAVACGATARHLPSIPQQGACCLPPPEPCLAPP